VTGPINGTRTGNADPQVKKQRPDEPGKTPRRVYPHQRRCVSFVCEPDAGSQGFRSTGCDSEAMGTVPRPLPDSRKSSVSRREYHDFAEVFSKCPGQCPADHRPYDLKITLADGGRLLGPSILSQEELLAPSVSSLMECSHGIHSSPRVTPWRTSHSSSGERRMGSLRTLLPIFGESKGSLEEGRYPLPLINDLLMPHARHESIQRSTPA